MFMSLFFVLLLYVVVVVNVNAQYSDVCLWGRNVTIHPLGATYRELNGLYRYEAIWQNVHGDSRPYYKLDRSNFTSCDPTYIFLYYDDNRCWTIGHTLGESLDILWAQCCQPSAGLPSLCSAGWKFYIGDVTYEEVDPLVTVTEGNCPSLNCSELSFTSSDDKSNQCWNAANLINTFEQIGDNVYYSAMNGYYWYFEPHMAVVLFTPYEK